MSVLFYVGHILILSGCKYLIASSWKEAIVNGKGVAGNCKSEGSHQQKQGYDAQKPDIRLTNGGQAGNELRMPIKTEFVHSKSGVTYMERSLARSQQK